MFVLHPLYQDKLPESYFFKTLEEAREAGAEDFNNLYTPDTKGFYVCEVQEYVGATKPELIYGSDIQNSIEPIPEEPETQAELPEEVTDEGA